MPKTPTDPHELRPLDGAAELGHDDDDDDDGFTLGYEYDPDLGVER